MKELSFNLEDIELEYFKDNLTLFIDFFDDVALRYVIKKDLNENNYIYAELVSLKEQRILLVTKSYSIDDTLNQMEIKKDLLNHFFYSITDSREIVLNPLKYKDILKISKFSLENVNKKDLISIRVMILNDFIIYYSLHKDKANIRFSYEENEHYFYKEYLNNNKNNTLEKLVLNLLNDTNEDELPKGIYLKLMNIFL